MDALRCPPPDTVVDTLSGGERRRVALCKLLLQQPDLLLLDEPTNHLDAESVQWLEGHLAAYPGAVLAVTHDRYFLDNVAEWILELDRGKTHPYEGNYSTYLETKKERSRSRAPRTPSAPRCSSASSSGSGRTRRPGRPRASPRLRATRRWRPRPSATARSTPPRSTSRPVRASVTSCSRPKTSRRASATASSCTTSSFTLPRAGIVGVIGPNGVGKTTLFRMIVGEEKPDEGDLTVGQTVKISYVDQSRGGIDPNKNVWEVVSDGLDFIKVANFEMNSSRAYVASFGFKGPDQQKKAGVLSGGERNRLNLALTLKMGGNLLLLDEPTNDLDVETLSVPGGRAARVPRLRRGHVARPVVPRPRGHPHPGVGG